MSHHLDSSAARADARLNISDMYVFRGDRGTVLVMNVCSDSAGPDAPKGFHPEARYEFKIDGTGDAVENLTYRLGFGAPDTDGSQPVELRRLVGAEAADDTADGTVLLTGRTGTTLSSGGGLRVWTGRAGDPFWMNPGVVEAVGQAFEHGTDVELPEPDPSPVTSLFSGQKVQSIVLEIPDGGLLPFTRGKDIGVWGVTALATDAGGWHRINRFGLPMVSPIFAQFDNEFAERLNQSEPADDADTFRQEIADRVAAVVGARGTTSDPHTYGEQVADRILPDILPYTIGTPAVFGFAKFNGRALTDNAGEVMFSLTTDSALGVGLGKEAVDAPATPFFPYLAPAA
ncbi:protein of unknown function [Streptomyces sp. DvalAA-14]|uniref:DUF4331 family protein n=1 Tax=unclassified Streptomyces TaxID=2593676 RepID=UPI00081BAB08|nr:MULTISPECIES: DUF4331 family protein [unclassified Streptomyces]MYS22145.1 DUF4331 domain-containing protein [Streptomyces sp. SID4948]SCE09649.1 protein of unknown function [Streptomyces sp. DvalAA-14]